MYIQPAQYLDLTDRLSIITKKYEHIHHEKTEALKKVLTLQQKVRMLQQQVNELQKQKQRHKQGLKQHVNLKAQNILQLISTTKQNERIYIEDKINKVRNCSAIKILQQLEQKIIQKRTVTFEKDFYEKVKTLYIIDKKKIKCTSQELLNWVKQVVNKSKNIQIEDPLTGINGSNQAFGTQKSMIKSMVKQKNGTKNKNNKRQSKTQQKIKNIQSDISHIQRPNVTIKQQNEIQSKQKASLNQIKQLLKLPDKKLFQQQSKSSKKFQSKEILQSI